MSQSTLIRWEEVGLTYEGPPPVEALRPVSLEIFRGDYVAIVGPSGAGKSSMLNLLGLLNRPTTGRQWYDGDDVTNLSQGARGSTRAFGIGFVFQAFHLLEDRTVTENVMLGLLYQKVNRRRANSMAQEAIERVGLQHRAKALASTLSGGERQRTAIARAVVGRPPLLLADEPTGNLDSATGEAILDLFAEIRDGDTTMIVVTHDITVASGAQRVITVRDGSATEAEVVV